MLSTNEIYKIAGESTVSPNTIRAYLTGKRVQGASKLRILKAAKAIGIELSTINPSDAR